jgi:hypothetical protein
VRQLWSFNYEIMSELEHAGFLKLLLNHTSAIEDVHHQKFRQVTGRVQQADGWAQ